MEYQGLVITPSMVINGDIRSSGNVLVEGKVFGNITCEGDATVKNVIVGDIKANSITLNGSKVKGSIKTKGMTSIGDNSIVVGNVKAGDVVVCGKLQGNINSKGNVSLEDTALVVGDINSSTVVSKSGARMRGSVSVAGGNSPESLDSEFKIPEEKLNDGGKQ